MEYYNPEMDSSNIIMKIIFNGLRGIPFLKRNKYSYQHEYRFVLHKECCTEEKVILEIGDISDISIKIKSEKIKGAYNPLTCNYTEEEI